MNGDPGSDDIQHIRVQNTAWNQVQLIGLIPVDDGVARVVPIVDLSQTVASADDIRAVPRVREGRRRAYPVRLLRYGLNIYPTSRIVKQNGGPSL